MGLHVGGIYIEADKKVVNQKAIAEFIKAYWLKLGAKESQKNPLKFNSLSLEKTGLLAFAIGPMEKDENGNEFIGIYDSERYRADAALARALAHHFGKDAWFFGITDSVNQAYVKKYGEKEETISKYDLALEKMESFPYPLLYFNQLQEFSEKELKKFKFLAFESIPHRPKAEYSGPSEEQLSSNNLVLKAQTYAREHNAEELLKLSQDHDVYYEVTKDAVELADPKKPEDLEFLIEMANFMIEKRDVPTSIVEAALRKHDEGLFESALKTMPHYNLYTLEIRGREIGNKGEHSLAFRLMEAYILRNNYQDPRLLNNAIHFLDRTIDKTGLSAKRLEKLLEDAYKAGPLNPAIYHNLACVFVKMKKYDQALDCVSKAVQYGYHTLDLMKKDSDLDPLRSDKRFEEAFQKKPIPTSLEHLKMNQDGKPWIVPSLGLHLYFGNAEAREGAALLIQELFKEFPNMFGYYLKSGYIQLDPTPKGKVSRDMTLLKKGGAKYGYTIYYNSIKEGGASDLRFLLELNDEWEGEISLQLPLKLAEEPEKLYQRLIKYAEKLPFLMGSAGYSFSPYYEGNGSPAEGDLYRLLEIYWGFTTSRQSLHLSPQSKLLTPNWLTFIGPTLAKEIDLKDIPKDRIKTFKNKGMVIRAAQKPFIGLSSNPADLDLLPRVTKALQLHLPKPTNREDYESYFDVEAKRLAKIINLEEQNRK